MNATRFVFAAILTSLASTAVAQNYPVKPIRIISEYIAGAGGDVFFRPLATSLSTATEQQWIVGLRDLIRFLSSVTTLMPGTLITTGTPAGVSKPADGDHLKGTIGGIGTMELNVVAEE